MPDTSSYKPRDNVHHPDYVPTVPTNDALPVGPATARPVDVEAGRDFSADWRLTAGSYDLTVHGPNGFLRQFKGSNTGDGPEVATRHSGRSDQFGCASRTISVGLEATNNWYDLTVASAQDSTFLRRLAGHIGTGRPSTSDPAIIGH